MQQYILVCLDHCHKLAEHPKQCLVYSGYVINSNKYLLIKVIIEFKHDGKTTAFGPP